MPSINKATLADVAELNTLINSAYRGESSKKGWTTEADVLGGTRIDEDTLQGYINDADTTVLKLANDDGKIDACVYLNIKDNKLYVGMLTVKPELQNAGIGRVLIGAAEEFAKENSCHTLWMTVITARHELIAYYERRGFTITGEKNPFPTETKFGLQKQPLELLVMEKWIG